MEKLVALLRRWVEVLDEDERKLQVAVLGRPGLVFTLEEIPNIIARNDETSELLLNTFMTYIHPTLSLEFIKPVGINEQTLKPLYVVIESEIARRTSRRMCTQV